MSDRKTILVTGGGGSIGNHLIPYLAKFAEVVSLDLKEVEAAHRSIVGSVTDSELVLKAVHGVDAVLHMAVWNSDYENFTPQVEVNITGTVNVLEACIAKSIPRVVLASTVMTIWGESKVPSRPAYHNFVPVYFYSYTKCAQELLAEMYTRQHNNFSAIAVRIGAPKKISDGNNRVGPKFGMSGDEQVLIAYDDLVEGIRLAVLEAQDIKYATVFMVGDYGDNYYFVEDTKKTLGLKYRWKIKPDPEADGVYVFERLPG